MNKLKIKNPIPQNNEEWPNEIAKAYLDAHETKSFGKLIGQSIKEKNLYQLAPALCLKFRGIKKTENIYRKATEAALRSYVASEDTGGDIFRIPQLSFAFCHLANHFGLDILAENRVAEIMDFLVDNRTELIQITD